MVPTSILLTSNVEKLYHCQDSPGRGIFSYVNHVLNIDFTTKIIKVKKKNAFCDESANNLSELL